MSGNNKLISYLLLLTSVFILFFITTSQYNKLQENLDTKDLMSSELLEKEEELTKLNKLRTLVKSEEAKKDMEKYKIDFKEDEIIKYIYDYAFSTNLKDTKMAIKNISFSEGVKNELGFLESNINISVRVLNEKAMSSFLDFLLSKDSKYVFFLDSFNYPYDSREGSFDISVPLKMFYIK